MSFRFDGAEKVRGSRGVSDGTRASVRGHRELEKGAIPKRVKRGLRAIGSQRIEILRDSTTKRLVRGHSERVASRSEAGSAEEAHGRTRPNLLISNQVTATYSLVSAACQRNVSETDLAEPDSGSRRRRVVAACECLRKRAASHDILRPPRWKDPHH